MRTLDLREAGGEGAQPPARTKGWQGTHPGQGLPLRPNVAGGGGPCQPPPYKCYSAPPFPFLPPCRACLPGAAIGILQLEFPLWRPCMCVCVCICVCVCVHVCGWSLRPQAPLSPPHLPHQLFSLPPRASGDTTHHGFGNSKKRPTTMKGTQPKRVRGSPEATQPD